MAEKKKEEKQELVANCNRLPHVSAEDKIFTIRDTQVIIDRDLAELYGTQTFRLNEQVRRNIKRFPESFRFQLTKEETAELIANCDRLSTMKHSSTLPYAFTEQLPSKIWGRSGLPSR
ncbi:MAG: ORF6N domain-containing protein [Bacteroidales bacterium]|nr:ORF6N domain-containing protein [Bacteroidales bacterium]